MELLTKINIALPNFTITHNDSICLVGSCFSDNIGSKLRQYGFDTTINPFGIMYNPISIFNNIEQIANKKFVTENELVFYKDIYHSLIHHGSFSSTDKESLIHNINQQIENTHDKLIGAKCIIFTLGTAYIYTYKDTNEIVANCHKLPQHFFEKSILSVDEIKNAFGKIIPCLKDKTVLFTVSPVRHWRDGAVQNQRSKSILIESIHQLIAENSNCYYFPSYEIMMDELRDYRFYTADMLHPNEIAINYIWKKFCVTYFAKDTMEALYFIDKGRQLFAHRVKNKHSAENELFETKKADFIKEFQSKYPAIKLDFITT